MKEVLMPIAIIGTFGASVYFFTKVLTEYILRKKMIEKGYVNEETQAIFRKKSEANQFAALKWGLIVLFGGISLIIMEFMDLRADSTMPYGILAVALSLGFLLYYYLVKREAEK